MKVARTKHRSDVQSVVAVDLLPGLVGTLSEHDRGWRLSHERSGLAIGQGVWSSPEEIVAAVARADAGAVDWTRPAAELRDDPRVHDLAKILTCTAPRRVEGHHLARPDELGDLPREDPTPAELREAAAAQQDPIAAEWLRRAAAALEATSDLAEEYLVELFELRRAVRAAAPRLAAEMIAAPGAARPPTSPSSSTSRARN